MADEAVRTLTVAELQAAFDAAREKSRTADIELREARAALETAQLEATGLAGHVVEYRRRRYGAETDGTRRFRVDRVVGPRLYGKAVKKDGTLGTMTYDAYRDQVTDLGPFKAPE